MPQTCALSYQDYHMARKGFGLDGPGVAWPAAAALEAGGAAVLLSASLFPPTGAGPQFRCFFLAFSAFSFACGRERKKGAAAFFNTHVRQKVPRVGRNVLVTSFQPHPEACSSILQS